jgi:nitrite reductase (NADH) large subunit
MKAGRKALAQRFLDSQQHAQVDPWAERARGADSNEFNPLNTMEVA